MRYRCVKILFCLSIAVVFLCLSHPVKAFTLGDVANFNINKDYDVNGRSQVSAILVKTSPNLYFYVEKDWWNSQPQQQQDQILADLDKVSSEFDSNIYPMMTSTFGSEWKPGIDNDNRITILFHSMQPNDGGYFRQNDEYSKLQVPDSNEREMMYLSLSYIDDVNNLKLVLAHELMHLIIFNQKNRIQGVQEETWLDEARSDYTSTLLGYDDTYQGSNLQARVEDFLKNPSDSLTEFTNSKYDFAIVHLFMSYLVNHYGISVLQDSLKSKKVGIASINEALAKENAKEDFAKAFTDWTIADVVNDCVVDSKYCYLSKNLESIRINPTLNFLPLTGNSSLSVTNVTKNWAGNWQKIVGGSGDLKVEFSSLVGLNFQVPYVVFDKNGSYSVNTLTLDKNERGEIDIKNFGDTYTSLILIPSLQTKLTGFDGPELSYPYSFTASVTGNASSQDQALIQKLLSQIDYLKQQIAQIQSGGNACSSLDSNLYLGVVHSSQVTCLQGFLASKGAEIYPEGLVTGNFGQLTKLAVIRFQKKYGISPTGFVGIVTRTKINQLLKIL